LIGIGQTPNRNGDETAAGLNGLVILGLFSDFFNVAASRPAKSPRNSPYLVLAMHLVNGSCDRVSA
jgi:hypothetical protein